MTWRPRRTPDRGQDLQSKKRLSREAAGEMDVPTSLSHFMPVLLPVSPKQNPEGKEYSLRFQGSHPNGKGWRSKGKTPGTERGPLMMKVP